MDEAKGSHDQQDQYKFEVHAKVLELTPEDLAAGITLFGAPLPKLSLKMIDVVKESPSVGWDFWPPTIAVTRIMLATQPAPGGNPPQTVSASVTVVGFGFRPGVHVRLKWNNAWGFPGTSIPLPDGVPNSGGRFSLLLQHTTVPKAGKDWVWEQMNQLVLVAQQLRSNGSIEFDVSYRPVPPHVLWQWVP